MSSNLYPHRNKLRKKGYKLKTNFAIRRIFIALTVSYYHNNNKRTNCSPKQITNNVDIYFSSLINIKIYAML